MHKTGRIEGSGRRWANVLAILSDVVYMSFYLWLQICKKRDPWERKTLDQLGSAAVSSLSNWSHSIHSASTRPQPMGRAATKSVARVYADVNAKLGPTWHEYGMVAFSSSFIVWFHLLDNLQVQWGSQDHYEIVRKVGRGKYSEVAYFASSWKQSIDHVPRSSRVWMSLRKKSASSRF